MWTTISDLDDAELIVGNAYYLVENINNGVTAWTIQARVPRTNVSRERVLHGWLGETNSVCRYARGVATIVEVDDDRARVQRVRCPAGSCEACDTRHDASVSDPVAS